MASFNFISRSAQAIGRILYIALAANKNFSFKDYLNSWEENKISDLKNVARKSGGILLYFVASIVGVLSIAIFLSYLLIAVVTRRAWQVRSPSLEHQAEWSKKNCNPYLGFNR
ncbi:MAG: hypothetical protein AB7H97_05920 [Pseudobdellovibrionaceae bacterium]